MMLLSTSKDLPMELSMVHPQLDLIHNALTLFIVSSMEHSSLLTTDSSGFQSTPTNSLLPSTRSQSTITLSTFTATSTNSLPLSMSSLKILLRKLRVECTQEFYLQSQSNGGIEPTVSLMVSQERTSTMQDTVLVSCLPLCLMYHQAEPTVDIQNNSIEFN